MKAGRQTRRFGGPSDTLLVRQRQAEERRRLEEDARAKVPAATGPLRIYLDDDRPCPKGWTLARTIAEFDALVAAHADRIERISLDWYLGKDERRGSVVADALAERLAAEPGFLPWLEFVTLHSSDFDEALAMMRRIALSLPVERRDDVMVEIGTHDAFE